MSTYLRKCIDIAPTAVITPGPFVANDYRNLRQQPWWTTLLETTTHLRLWADWPALQRVANESPGFGDAAASLSALDAQIDAAVADGMKVILLPYRYPRWSNATEGIPTGAPDWEFMAWDRHARLAQYLDFIAGRRPTQTWKAWEYRMPHDGFGPESQWATFVEWLWDRYAAQVTAVEVVNEPNLQIWPQRTTIDTDDWTARWGTEGTTLLSTPAVAQMMVTMDAIARGYPDGPLLLAPSASDSDVADIPRSTTISHTNPHAVSADPFVESLLAELDSRGFAADERWVWSFHNYADIERKQVHVVYLRAILAEHGWSGRQLDHGPELWSTEGGCRINATNTRFSGTFGRALTDAERREYQARVLTEALSRHHYAKGIGAGIGMLTQYTTYADGFNSGVLEPASTGGTARPALAAWCAVPEFHAAPVQRAAWRPQF